MSSNAAFFGAGAALPATPSAENPFYFPSSPSVFDSLSIDAAGAVYNTPWDEPHALSDHSSDASPQLSPVLPDAVAPMTKPLVVAAKEVVEEEEKETTRRPRRAAAQAAAVLIKQEPVDENDVRPNDVDVDPMAAVRAAALVRPFGATAQNSDAEYTPVTPLFKPALAKAKAKKKKATRKSPKRASAGGAGGRKKRGRKRDHPELNETEYRRMVKEKHLAIERRRREQINESIENLRQLVPECEAGEFKGNVLVKTVDYLRRIEEELAFYRRNFHPEAHGAVHDVRVAVVRVEQPEQPEEAQPQPHVEVHKEKKAKKAGGFESAVDAVLRMSMGAKGKLSYSPSLGATPPLSSLNLHLPPLALDEGDADEVDEVDEVDEACAAGLGLCARTEQQEQQEQREQEQEKAEDVQESVQPAVVPPPAPAHDEQLVSQPRGLNWTWLGFLVLCIALVLLHPFLAEAHATYADELLRDAPAHGHMISTGLAACGVVEMAPLVVSFVRACMAAQQAPGVMYV